MEEETTAARKAGGSGPVAVGSVVAVLVILTAVVALARQPDGGDTPTASAGTTLGPTQTSSTVTSPPRGTVPPTPGTTAIPPPPDHTITVYGSAGTFRNVPAEGRTSTGHDIVTAAVPNWGFELGASAFFAAVTDGGRVIFATVPQTDNQAVPLGQTMSVGVLDPTGPTGATFQSLRIPTTKQLQYVTSPGAVTGGADVSDLCNVTSPAGRRVVGISAVPYKGWDFNFFGVWPALAFFGDDPTRDGADAVTYLPSESHTPDELRNDVSGKEAFALHENDYGTFADTRGLGECDVTPRGFVVASQYFFDETENGHAGSLVAFTPSGHVAAFLALPDAVLSRDTALQRADGTTVVLAAGTALELSPREVRADPHTTAPDDQRFVVVYDAAAPDPGRPGEHVSTPFSLQEFRFDERAGTITPSSDPVVTDADASADTTDGTYLRANSTVYAPDGTLFVTRSETAGAASLLSAPLVVFRPGSLGGRAGTPAPWGTLVTPDAVIDPPGVAPLTTVRSMSFDDQTGSVLLVGGVDARLRAFRWNGWDGDAAATGTRARPTTTYCDVDLGGTLLANPAPGYRMQVRQGAIDPARRVLYVPLQGLQPVADPKAEEYVPQYAFGVRLDRVVGPDHELGHCGP